jgi:hypothetical protein
MSKTEYAKIYDNYYKRIADLKNYKITDKTKAVKIDKIFKDLDFEDQVAIKIAVRYSNIPRKQTVKILEAKSYNHLIKAIDKAERHMYSPNNIRIAVPTYYSIKKKKMSLLLEKDFSDKRYILNALHKSGFMYREQLLKHLELGWYYLWTIPGIGDNAKQLILKAIDNWGIKIKEREL